jgi:hypothetical protein
MAKSRLAVAQKGVTLVEATGGRPRAARPGRRKARRARGAASLTGPFLSPGALSLSERLRLIDGLEIVLDGVYTHLPLKRARYGFDPIQRLRILRTQAGELTDDRFHHELADIVTRLRDAHTRYAGPSSLSGKVAALPFLVEMIGKTEAPTYIVTKVGRGLDASFKPGVALEYWNGVPIDRAVERHGDRDVGGRPDTQRAWAVQSLTLRSLQYGPPPDEHWVIVGYRTVTQDGGAGPSKEIKIPWQVLDPNEVAAPPAAPAARMRRSRRLALAVDPAAAAVRRAKMLLFAPQALTGRQSKAPAIARTSAKRSVSAEIIPTELTETLKAMSIDAAGGPFGYLRIWAFDTLPEPFIEELLRLLPLLPDRGLILDVRGNPGGYIWAAELALQLFTPREIQPTRFSVLATPFTRRIAAIGDLAEEFEPWKASLEAAVRNGEAYAQPIPITDVAECNAIGQRYGGPVVLVADSTSYSSGDLFSAGFVDNGIGPFHCVGTATGAGGANVWDYAGLRQALAGSPAALPSLPHGIDLSLSFRRATRSGPSEGLPIEDVGVAGVPYVMTRDDLLHDNRDMVAALIAELRTQPFSRCQPMINKPARTIDVATSGLDRLNLLADGHPVGSSVRIADGETASLPYPAGTRMVEITGFAGDELRQRRRLPTR